MSDQLLAGNATVVTLDEKSTFIDKGAVLCENGVIKKVGSTGDLLREYPGAHYMDLEGRVLMPGMINVHHHLYSTFARGMGIKDEAPENFVQILERLWWRLDNALSMEDIYISALIPLIEGIRRGTTTIIDHHASQHKIPGSLDELSKAAVELGVRHCLCYETSDRWGQEIADEGIEENERFIKLCKEQPDDLRAAAFGLHAAFTIGDETLRKSIEVVKKYGSFFHCHVAEDRADEEDSMKKYGMPIMKRFEKSGALDGGFMAIHCIHINEEEEDIIKGHNVLVVHNPESNMNNGVGCARVPKFLEKEITVGLGTDGFTSDMFRELAVMPLPHRLLSKDPRTFTFPQIFQTYFQNNPAIAGKFFNKPLGVIKEGAFADMIVLDYDPPTPFSGNTFLGHCLFGFP